MSEPIRDKEQSLSINELFNKMSEVRKLDVFAVVMKLFDKSLIWYHTNIQNARHHDRILQARTYTDINRAHFDTFKSAVAAGEMTEEELKEILAYTEETNKVVLNVTENYAEIRKSAKGLTAKQIERITSGNRASDKEMDKLFRKGDTPK